jgi:hypothetical protein
MEDKTSHWGSRISVWGHLSMCFWHHSWAEFIGTSRPPLKNPTYVPRLISLAHSIAKFPGSSLIASCTQNNYRRVHCVLWPEPRRETLWTGTYALHARVTVWNTSNALYWTLPASSVFTVMMFLSHLCASLVYLHCGEWHQWLWCVAMPPVFSFTYRLRALHCAACNHLLLSVNSFATECKNSTNALKNTSLYGCESRDDLLRIFRPIMGRPDI